MSIKRNATWTSVSFTAGRVPRGRRTALTSIFIAAGVHSSSAEGHHYVRVLHPVHTELASRVGEQYYEVYVDAPVFAAITKILTWNFPRMSSSRNKLNSSSPKVNVVPPYSGSSTVSPTLTLTVIFAPVSVTRPGPTAITSPSLVLPSLLSGR